MGRKVKGREANELKLKNGRYSFFANSKVSYLNLMIRKAHRIISLCIIGGFILCIIVFLLFRALRSSPDLSEKKFVDIYVQLSIAHETFVSDTLKLKEEKDKILQQAGVTQKEMDHFVKRHDQNPGEWTRIWKKIMDRLSEESIKEEGKQKPQ